MLTCDQVFNITRTYQISWEGLWELRLGTTVIIWFPAPNLSKPLTFKPWWAVVMRRQDTLVILDIKGLGQELSLEVHRTHLNNNYVITRWNSLN